jgi:hypothetical protein
LEPVATAEQSHCMRLTVNYAKQRRGSSRQHCHTHTRDSGCSRAGRRSPHKNAIQKYDFHLRFVHTFSFSYVIRVNLTAKFHLTLPSAEAGFIFLGRVFGIRLVRVLGASSTRFETYESESFRSTPLHTKAASMS